ncbi:MAG: ABC transporter permease [Deltaproteobacteria bacterium]|nr:ABC transporter permease [Deltaproteobacteria bacterium]
MLKSISTSITLAQSDFKLRNENSVLGIFWYLLDPILMFALLYLVFNDRIGQNIHCYPLQLIIGIVFFNFFQKATSDATGAIVNNGQLLHTFPFPPAVLVLSIIVKHLIGHAIEWVLCLLIFAYYGWLSCYLFYYPLLICAFLVFILGLSFTLAALSVYISDIIYLYSFFLRLLWLATPIFYSIDGQSRLYLLNLFNPIYYYITAGRELFVYQHSPSILIIGGAIFYAILSLCVGVCIFNKLQLRFAERL